MGRSAHSIPILALLVASFGFQAQAVPGPRLRTSGSTVNKRPGEVFLDKSDFVAKEVDAMASYIDITLAGRKYTQKPNTSSIDVSEIVTHEEGGYLKTSTDFGVNLRLPNLEKRWQLRFSSYDEEEDSRDLTQQRVRTRPRPRDYGGALFFFEKLGDIKATFIPRLVLKNPLEVSYVLRLESAAERKRYRLVPRLDLFADPYKGTGEYFSLDFLWDITKRYEFSIQNNEEYHVRDDNFTTQHGVALDYALNKKQAVGGSVTASTWNRAHFNLDTYTIAAAFTQEIYVQRLKYALSPYMAFRRYSHFKGKAGITLTMDLTF